MIVIPWSVQTPPSVFLTPSCMHRTSHWTESEKDWERSTISRVARVQVFRVHMWMGEGWVLSGPGPVPRSDRLTPMDLPKLRCDGCGWAHLTPAHVPLRFLSRISMASATLSFRASSVSSGRIFWMTAMSGVGMGSSPFRSARILWS